MWTLCLAKPTHKSENLPYNRLAKALKELKLDNKGYDLYSFKHTSNIAKYNAGWNLAQIKKANRHASIAMTEVYLRKIGEFTDMEGLDVPSI